MSLREQLRDILPQILPTDPSESIKGTELIRLVRYRLGAEYSDATLRYHFSILSYDPTSPIAKVDQGQGYYLRLHSTDAPYLEPISQGLFDGEGSALDIERLRYARFRSIIERLNLHQARYPFLLRQNSGGHWELPDLIITDWDLEPDRDERPQLDQPIMHLKSQLGVSTVSITAALLKLSVGLESCRHDFFQTLSSTHWANRGELLLAEKVRDEALVESLRTLGQRYGIGVTSLGLDLATLDELPAPGQIRQMSASEFESLQTYLQPQRISVGTHRNHLDWQTFATLKQKHHSISQLTRWLNDCLEKGRPFWASKEDGN